MITVRNLTKKVNQDTVILDKLSLQVDKGDLIAIVGPSGSGKTTLLRCLSMQTKWDGGQYIYQNQDITHINPLEKLKIKQHWAFLTETPDVNLRSTAFRNVVSNRFYQMSLLRKLSRTVSQEEHMRAMDYLEKVGLLDIAHEKLEKLSGGERQRVAIAKALVKGASVLFADDPVRGLPEDAQHRLMQDLRNLCKQEQVTVLCALSNLELAERYATRIWGLANGKIAVDIAARRLTAREKQLVFG